jgi:hypothetical protein
MENMEALEKRLWSSADNLRANSPCASNEYFLPVMGLIFLRHSYSRYLAVKDGIEASLPKRSGKILMLDARNVYRQVTRKIYDFSPEQMKKPHKHCLSLP